MPLAEVRIGRGQWVIVLQVEKPNLSGVLLNSKCRKKPELFDGGSAVLIQKPMGRQVHYLIMRHFRTHCGLPIGSEIHRQHYIF